MHRFRLLDLDGRCIGSVNLPDDPLRKLVVLWSGRVFIPGGLDMYHERELCQLTHIEPKEKKP